MHSLAIHDRATRPSRSNRHSAFTLIELLVVMTIMVSLAGMLTYALASAQTDARIKRTQADLLTIGQLLQTRMNEVSLSRVPLTFGPTTNAVLSQAAPPFGPGSPPNNASEAQLVLFQSAERARLLLMARRDLLRMVLPECQADLLYPPATLQFRTRDTRPAPGFRPAPFIPNVAQVAPPSQWNQMRSMLNLLSANSLDAAYGPGNPATLAEDDAIMIANNDPTFDTLLRTRIDGSLMTWTRQHESSECLYLILSTMELFGTRAIDQIPPSRIVDTDQDGVPEILDAWGQPYMFIRNPIGLNNPAIKNFRAGAATPAELYPIVPDPLDLLISDFRYLTVFRPTPDPRSPADNAYHPIYLPPVLISAGRDKEFGIRRSFFDTDNDGVGDEGVMNTYSASVVQFPVNGAFRLGPTYPGVPIWRYPDPYFDVSTMPITATGPHEITPEGIATAKEGGGLGATIVRDTAADNITSLDAGF